MYAYSLVTRARGACSPTPGQAAPRPAGAWQGQPRARLRVRPSRALGDWKYIDPRSMNEAGLFSVIAVDSKDDLQSMVERPDRMNVYPLSSDWNGLLEWQERDDLQKFRDQARESLLTENLEYTLMTDRAGKIGAEAGAALNLNLSAAAKAAIDRHAKARFTLQGQQVRELFGPVSGNISSTHRVGEILNNIISTPARCTEFLSGSCCPRKKLFVVTGVRYAKQVVLTVSLECGTSAIAEAQAAVLKALNIKASMSSDSSKTGLLSITVEGEVVLQVRCDKGIKKGERLLRVPQPRVIALPRSVYKKGDRLLREPQPRGIEPEAVNQAAEKNSEGPALPVKNSEGPALPVKNSEGPALPVKKPEGPALPGMNPAAPTFLGKKVKVPALLECNDGDW